MTEPGTGSDLQRTRAKAIRTGDDYVIDGAKTFISNGYVANLVIAVANPDPDDAAAGPRWWWSRPMTHRLIVIPARHDQPSATPRRSVGGPLVGPVESDDGTLDRNRVAASGVWGNWQPN